MSLERRILVSGLHPLGAEKLSSEGPQPFIPPSPRPAGERGTSRAGGGRCRARGARWE